MMVRTALLALLVQVSRAVPAQQRDAGILYEIWHAQGYLDRVGDINVDMDTQPVEAGHKGITRVLPKDGADYSRTRSMAQRVDLRMCESVSPYSDDKRMLVHLDIMEKLLGHKGTHSKKALLRRSARDARKADERRRPEVVEARRNTQLAGAAAAAAAAPAAAPAAGEPPPAPPPPSRPTSRVRIELPPTRTTRRRLGTGALPQYAEITGMSPK